ncbi:hypothetical protein BJ508DRAFT_416206 [Ascobolus immersus RN42]|uniref:Uncharacterized protein n=1 Tax=Ascobolus immersus RN42 TaxID=1160509 RepID=A0A3N4HZ96_ASCIM|nr:hypothetical protein BJ508DRAFT_416206 [Ascobolus immersus RN42]
MATFTTLPTEIHHEIAYQLSSFSQSLLTLSNLTLVSHYLNTTYAPIFAAHLFTAAKAIEGTRYAPLPPLSSVPAFAPLNKSPTYWAHRIAWLPPAFFRHLNKRWGSGMGDTILKDICEMLNRNLKPLLVRHFISGKPVTPRWQFGMGMVDDSNYRNICSTIHTLLATNPRDGTSEECEAFFRRPAKKVPYKAFFEKNMNVFLRDLVVEGLFPTEDEDLEVLVMVMEILFDRLGLDPFEWERRGPGKKGRTGFLYEGLSKPLEGVILREAEKAGVALKEGTEPEMVYLAVRRLLLQFAVGAGKIAPLEEGLEVEVVGKMVDVIEGMVEAAGGWRTDNTLEVMDAWRNGEMWPIAILGNSLFKLLGEKRPDPEDVADE